MFIYILSNTRVNAYKHDLKSNQNEITIYKWMEDNDPTCMGTSMSSLVTIILRRNLILLLIIMKIGLEISSWFTLHIGQILAFDVRKGIIMRGSRFV